MLSQMGMRTYLFWCDRLNLLDKEIGEALEVECKDGQVQIVKISGTGEEKGLIKLKGDKMDP